MNYLKLSNCELENELKILLEKFEEIKKQNFRLDISRGKPSQEQLKLSLKMLDLDITKDGLDIFNYGILCGIPDARLLMSVILGCGSEDVIIGGNSSLCLMSDVISFFFTHGVNNEKWDINDTKFLAPCPGYDRHFALCEHFGIKMIPIKMNHDGPDIDEIEKLVSKDESIKGMWCVPKFSNPGGEIYSDCIIERIAKLRPSSKSFRIFWDNAYSVHELYEKIEIKNIFKEIKKNNNENLVIAFASTSKITFSGGGISAIGCKGDNFKSLCKHYSFKTIGFDKINQTRHVKFLTNSAKDIEESLRKHMLKHSEILRPKFNLILEKFKLNFCKNPILSWSKPKGGYFISIKTFGSAKKIVQLCREAGLVLTQAGSMFPYNLDPDDSMIRIAPSYPTLEEISKATKILILCIKISAIEKLKNHAS
ncbi:MAG: aminotransferase [Candidatus Improbicoccus pseudotrichonymphae]|uniref:Aminotransferase n=1 Tax=Candidatus Improbicoccus pseudotrichonymphae TaxID=3033792 RepID=A0AA48I7T3_9FIRM|nr:MAG: aminotransferase [Candidatus Improbicoccus pseudotrichonymphae]